MQYIAIQYAAGVAIQYVGPFPSQCQAMSYCEAMTDPRITQVRWQASRLIGPAFMPDQIHELPLESVA